MVDLPRRLSTLTFSNFQEIRASAAVFKRNAWGAALGVLDREATLVHIAACAMHTGKSLSRDEVARLGVAAGRIAQAREVLR